MSFGKCEIFIVVIATVYCVCLHETGTNATEGNNFATSDLIILEHELLKSPEPVTDDEVGTVNETESKVPQQAECRCKNGRCRKKDGQEVCECFPEFAKINDTDCKYCDCGPGFNCTYRTMFGTTNKICQCTDDYQQRDNKCKIKCSDQRPCQNGGTCSAGECECPKDVSGDLCESYRYCEGNCQRRDIVDCVYNQNTDYYSCVCKDRSLVYDDNDETCKPCPCGEGTCTERYRSVACDCNRGYVEYKGTCKRCDCGWPSDCRLDGGGRKQCTCRDGYVEREGQCVSCDCGASDIKCSLKNGLKICECPEGYQDQLGYCVDINECQSSPCHYTALCVNAPGSFTCRCEKGYQGVNGRYTQVEIDEECEDINECDGDSWICLPWKEVQCYNLPGTYKCMCKAGYQPVDINVTPQSTRCEEYRKSWVPAIIVIAVTLFMIAFTVWIHKCVKKT